jgi:cell division protein FtsI/penicillin-binding protein 2
MMRHHAKVTSGFAVSRVQTLALIFLLLTAFIVARLFVLQVIDHDYYVLFAENTHGIYEKIHARRGEVFFQDSRTNKEFPAAINRNYYIVYAVPHDISPNNVASTTEKIATLLGMTSSTEQAALFNRLADNKSYYAPLAKKVSSTLADAITAAKIPGIQTSPQELRFYPEGQFAGNVLGFVGSDADGNYSGKYGLEQYYDKEIAGRGGLITGEKGALGSWISLDKRTVIPAEDGVDVLLTIDRTLEEQACSRLARGMSDYHAKSGALILMNAKTGAVLALCSLPDFDPNNYSTVTTTAAYNNTAVFTQYEPGSVFKAVTMAAALDLEAVTPNTSIDTPCVRYINKYPIHNAENKCYGTQTMTGILENSINTGMVWVEEKIGRDNFKKYVDAFGFGKQTGVTLAGESAGNVAPLDRPGAIFGAAGSFGQGITATPIQIAAAYAAIANAGKLPKVHVVQELRYPSGKVEKVEPEVMNQVISPHASQLLSAMLTSVVENHYTRARIPGYYVAGKTGTAQIPGPGGYSEETNHTFAGFAPATNPELVLVVKYEKPDQHWAEQTTLPVFKDVLEYALNYYGFSHDKR